ncbi:MAG: hypothetical protein HYT62_01085 [Candidatus Yanofskybacteria bacterium]|nr:hypothetical protein [Candidatus Yanofskybacteria bacterium]
MERIEEKNSDILEQEIINLAISSGKIQNEEVYDLQLGMVENYVGEGVIEFDGNRYKVIGYPLVRSGDKIVKRGWIQVYKMREWQE